MIKQNKYRVSAIVPAYNEEKKIAGVLKTLVSCPLLHEVICVNDGSTDNTAYEIRKVKGVRLINGTTNLGKSYAIVKGVKAAEGDIVIFIDGDLEGLSDLHIKKLTSFLISGKFSAAIGYYCFYHIDELFRPLSGERAYFREDLIKHLDTLKTAGYGLELQLNYLFKDKKVKVFKLKGVRHYLKHQKQPYDTVARLMLRESRDIITHIFKQDDPVEYLSRSYFSPFYFTRRNILKKQFAKLIETIKRLQRDMIKT